MMSHGIRIIKLIFLHERCYFSRCDAMLYELCEEGAEKWGTYLRLQGAIGWGCSVQENKSGRGRLL